MCFNERKEILFSGSSDNYIVEWTYPAMQLKRYIHLAVVAFFSVSANVCVRKTANYEFKISINTLQLSKVTLSKWNFILSDILLSCNNYFTLMFTFLAWIFGAKFSHFYHKIKNIILKIFFFLKQMEGR